MNKRFRLNLMEKIRELLNGLLRDFGRTITMINLIEFLGFLFPTLVSERKNDSFYASLS